jgi:tripartite-type tricarboxylate transporter receptor subunit TctC
MALCNPTSIAVGRVVRAKPDGYTILSSTALSIRSLAVPTVGARLADLVQEIFPPDQETPEAFRALQKAEVEKWLPIIRELGIKAE